MGTRGKREIKRIENSTNRQVTYSKRKGGLFKKAHELTLLCDAQVCLLMISGTNKFHDYCSPSTTTKAIFDRYQKSSETNIWREQYDKMKKSLRQLEETNSRLREEIRQRKGEELDELNMNELRCLEEDLEASLDTIGEKKNKQLQTQTETYKKKVKSLEYQHQILLNHLRQRVDDARYIHGYVDGDLEIN